MVLEDKVAASKSMKVYLSIVITDQMTWDGEITLRGNYFLKNHNLNLCIM